MLKEIVVKKGYGRLGNRLYRMGNFIALAEEHELRVIDFSLPEEGYQNYFEGTEGANPCIYPMGTGDGLSVEESGRGAVSVRNVKKAYPLSFERLCRANSERIYFEGFHFQADALVEKHWEAICRYLKPLEEFRKLGDSIVAGLKAQNRTVVGCHIRHGDFRGWASGDYFFGAEEYARLMRELDESAPDRELVFLVFSDEIQNGEAFAGLNVEFAKGSEIEDLYSMSQCDYIIGPSNSTFSGWASYFGGTPKCTVVRSGQSISFEDFVGNKVLNNSVRG